MGRRSAAGETVSQIIQSAKPSFQTVLTSSGTVSSGLYNFSGELTTPCILSILLNRENGNNTDNIVFFNGNANVAVKCAPNNNTGVEIYNNVTITATGITFREWYCGYEYQGVLAQDLCKKITVLALEF